MNKTIIVGNLATDPEAYTTQNGLPRSSFRVAVQRPHKNSNGERVTDFLTVVAWRQTAEFCNRYLTKGRKIAVEGSIQNRSYDAQDGSKRWVTEIIADSVEALGRSENDGDQNEQKRQAPKAEGSKDGFAEVDDEDLPF